MHGMDINWVSLVLGVLTWAWGLFILFGSILLVVGRALDGPQVPDSMKYHEGNN